MNYQSQHYRLLNQRATDSNIEQLVRESPIPQGLLHNSLIETDRHNGRFHSPRAGRPVYASAMAKCHSFSFPQAQFAPFRSPQTLNHSNSLAASIFRNLKNNASFDGDHSSLDVSKEQRLSNEDDMSFSSQSHNGNIHSLCKRPSLQNITQNRSMQQFRGHNNQIVDNNCIISSDNRHGDDSSLYINQRLVSTSNNSDKWQQCDPRTSDVISRPSGDYGLPSRLSAGSNNSYEETFHDAFVSTETMNESNMEPCSLFMWIIKPVPGANKICVEGKKGLTDDEFWHSGEITRRLGEKLVATQTGSLYKLEGNMEILDAMAAGFSRKTADAFWLGFPADWDKLIDDHFKAVVRKRTEEVRSDSEDEITAIEEDEVGFNEVNDDILEHPRSEDDVDSLGVDGARVMESEAVPEPRKKQKSKSSETKDVVLENWIIKTLPGGKGINVLGTKLNGLLWHSSAIEKRLDKRHLLSSSGATYKLKGPLDKLVALNEGLPMPIITRFKDGFPKEWLELIQEYFNDEKVQKKKLSKQQKSKNAIKTAKKGKENVNKENSKKETSAKKTDTKALKSSKAENVSSKMVEKKSYSAKRTPLNKTPIAVDLHETSKTVITPRGEVVDLETLGRSRSGRLIKPPLQWWTGQTLELQGDSVLVKAPTVGASMFVRNFEQEFEKTSRKLKPYWNPRQKDKDYSLNSSKNLSIVSSVSSDNDTVSEKTKSNLMSNDSIDTKIEVEVKFILEKAKSGRKSRGKRETCYGQVKNKKSENEGNNPFELNESTDCDGGVETEPETVNKKPPRRLSLKTARARRQEEADKSINQENVVSSSSGDMNQRTVGETEDIVDDNVRNLRSKGTIATNVSIVMNENRQTRQSRHKTLSVILEDDKVEEENIVPQKKVVRGRPTKKKSLKKGDTSSEPVTNNEAVDDHWTKEEKDKLAEACKTVSVTHPHYWENIADMVRTKSAEACKDFYYQNEKMTTSSEKKSRKGPTKEKQKVTALTANVGTLKRKQQLRDMLDQQNENYSDDLFDSTPYRLTRKRKIPKLGDVDDDAIFEELAKKQGKSKFETPVATGMMTSRITVPFASSKKTPKSSINIEEVKRAELDGYVHNMMKRRLLSKGRKKVKETPKVKKTIPVVELSPRQKLLFKEYVSEKKEDAENYVDSDQEEDYYWEDEET